MEVVRMTSPAPVVAHLEITAGDDAKAADGRALSWGPSQTWPDLAGASLKMVVGHFQFNLYGNLPVTWTGTVPASPDSPSTVSLDVAAAQSASLPQDEYDYMLTATLSDGDTVTLATGKLTVLAAPGMVPLYPPAT
jgi:hypothetical protein